MEGPRTITAPSESRWEIHLAAAHDDTAAARALCDALHKGARVFWQERDVEPGEDKEAAAARALSAAGMVGSSCRG